MAPRVTARNYNRIAAGMHRSDVDAILGPPGDFTTYPTRDAGPPVCESFDPAGVLPAAQSACWRGNNGTIRIDFDAKRTVVGKRFYPARRVGESEFEQFLAFLRQVGHDLIHPGAIRE
jgi:hypothetical protein